MYFDKKKVEEIKWKDIDGAHNIDDAINILTKAKNKGATEIVIEMILDPSWKAVRLYCIRHKSLKEINQNEINDLEDKLKELKTKL